MHHENVWIRIKISLKFVPKGPVNNIPAMVQIMAWRRPGAKPLSEPMVVSLPMHIYVARPQWVKSRFECTSWCHHISCQASQITNNKEITKGPLNWPFVRGIHWWPVVSLHNGSVLQKVSWSWHNHDNIQYKFYWDCTTTPVFGILLYGTCLFFILRGIGECLYHCDTHRWVMIIMTTFLFLHGYVPNKSGNINYFSDYSFNIWDPFHKWYMSL